MEIQTQAQQFAAAYAANMAKANLKTIKVGKAMGWVVMVIAMIVSYSHQRDYLIAQGAPRLGAFLIPIAFDAATIVCVRQAGTPAMSRRGKITALAVMPFPVGVSMVVNFTAPGTLIVKVIFALSVALIATTELVSGTAEPDFAKMDAMERKVAGTATVQRERKVCLPDCACKRHARNKPPAPRSPGRPRKAVSKINGYQVLPADTSEVARTL